MTLKKVLRTADGRTLLIFFHKGKYYNRSIKISSCAERVTKRLRAEAVYQVAKVYKELGFFLKTKKFYYKKDTKLIGKAVEMLLENRQ